MLERSCLPPSFAAKRRSVAEKSRIVIGGQVRPKEISSTTSSREIRSRKRRRRRIQLEGESKLTKASIEPSKRLSKEYLVTNLDLVLDILRFLSTHKYFRSTRVWKRLGRSTPQQVSRILSHLVVVGVVEDIGRTKHNRKYEARPERIKRLIDNPNLLWECDDDRR